MEHTTSLLQSQKEVNKIANGEYLACSAFGVAVNGSREKILVVKSLTAAMTPRSPATSGKMHNM